MATNIKSISVGGTQIQSGNGVPAHISDKGTLFVDLDTGNHYINKDGIASWQQNVDATNSGATASLSAFTSFSSTTTGESFIQPITANDTLSFSGINVDIFTDNTNKILTFSAGTSGGGGADGNDYTTGTTLINNTLYFDRNDTLSAYTADLSSYENLARITGGSQSNGTLSLKRDDNSVVAVDVSALNRYTTGTTLVGTTLYFDRSDSLSAYTADLSSFLDDTNFYVTGGTVIGSNLYLDRNDTLSAATIDVSSLLDNTDNYTTGTTLINNTLYFNRTNALSAFTTDLSFFNNNVVGVMEYNGSWTNNGDGTLTLPQIQVSLSDTTSWSGKTQIYTVSSGTTGTDFTGLVDENTNWIYVDYNGGSPTYVVTDTEPDYFRADRAKFLTVFRLGNFLHILDWDKEGSGLPNKILQRHYEVNYIERASGLALSLSAGTNVIESTSGIVWNGVDRTNVSAANSNDDTFFTVYHSGGTWTQDTTGSTVNNAFYDNGTNLVALNNNRYVVNWIYRGVETASHVYQVIGSDEYTTIASAQLESAPSVPELISSHGILIGRIIMQQGVTGGVVEGAFDTTFAASQVTSHNDLSGLQGGTSSEYYHLTQAQHSNLTNLNTFSTFSSSTAGQTTVTADTLNDTVILSGINVSILTDNATNTLTFSATTGGGGGETNTASNVGGGEGLFSGKSGVDLQFKSLTSTGGTVTITSTGATVNLESSGGGGTDVNDATKIFNWYMTIA